MPWAHCRFAKWDWIGGHRHTLSTVCMPGFSTQGWGVWKASTGGDSGLPGKGVVRNPSQPRAPSPQAMYPPLQWSWRRGRGNSGSRRQVCCLGRESLNSLLLSTKNSEVLLPWRWLLGWWGWLLAKAGVGAPVWPASPGWRARLWALLTLLVATVPCPHGQGCCGGSPTVPQLHSGPWHGEGSKPLEHLCLSQQLGAMGEVVSMRPEGLGGNPVDRLRNLLQGRGREPQAICPGTGGSPQRGLWSGPKRKTFSVAECPSGKCV